MVPAINRALQRLLYQYGNIDQREVDISFETPTRERIGSLIKPTIFLFLYDIRENLDLRQGGNEAAYRDGRMIRLQPARRFNLSYMVCALTSTVDDEHLLLWRSLSTLAHYSQIPADLQDQELLELEPPLTAHVPAEEMTQQFLSLWSSLNQPLHAAFPYVVTAPATMRQISESPLVLSQTIRYSGVEEQAQPEERRAQIGGIVRNQQGIPLAGLQVALVGSTRTATTDDEGRFVLYNVPSGAVQVQITHNGTVQHATLTGQPSGTEPHPPHAVILDSGSTPTTVFDKKEG